jgi:hypothetical protein
MGMVREGSVVSTQLVWGFRLGLKFNSNVVIIKVMDWHWTRTICMKKCIRKVNRLVYGGVDLFLTDSPHSSAAFDTHDATLTLAG